MENSGLALRIGRSIVDLFGPVGDIGVHFGLNLATTLLNAFVSNSASVSLLFPIGYSIAKSSTTISLRAGIVDSYYYYLMIFLYVLIYKCNKTTYAKSFTIL